VVRRLLAVMMVAVVTAAGCGTGTSTTQRANQQNYVGYVHQAAPDIGAYKSDGQLISLGRAVCDGFRARANTQQIADLLERTGGRKLPPSDLGAIISGAVKELCPAYSGRLNPVGS
jgi:hypothetical protein